MAKVLEKVTKSRFTQSVSTYIDTVGDELLVSEMQKKLSGRQPRFQDKISKGNPYFDKLVWIWPQCQLI